MNQAYINFKIWKQGHKNFPPFRHILTSKSWTLRNSVKGFGITTLLYHFKMISLNEEKKETDTFLPKVRQSKRNDRFLSILVFGAAFFMTLVFLITLPDRYIFITILPFFVICLLFAKALHITLFNSFVLSLVWCPYLLVVSSFLYFIVGKYFILSIYAPFIIIASRKPHDEISCVFLWSQTIFWDLPLMIWMNITHFAIGGRSMQV